MLSRVAESLYWLTRYIERAESNARILDVNMQLTLDCEESGESSERAAWEPIIATLADQKLFASLYPTINGRTVCEFETFATENPNSICSCISAARENARTVREYISSEMWERVNTMYLWVHSEAARRAFLNSSIDFFRSVVDYSHQFHGTTDSTLVHGEGWEFMQFGKFLERADNTSRILDLKYHILLPRGERVGGAVDTIQWSYVLKSCSGYEAFCKVRPGDITPWDVAEFLILNDRFPRSIRFCVEALDAALHRISGCDRQHFSNEAERLSGRLTGDLHYETIANIFGKGLHEYLDSIQLRLIEIGSAAHRTYCEWIEGR